MGADGGVGWCLSESCPSEVGIISYCPPRFFVVFAVPSMTLAPRAMPSDGALRCHQHDLSPFVVYQWDFPVSSLAKCRRASRDRLGRSCVLYALLAEGRWRVDVEASGESLRVTVSSGR